MYAHDATCTKDVALIYFQRYLQYDIFHLFTLRNTIFHSTRLYNDFETCIGSVEYLNAIKNSETKCNLPIKLSSRWMTLIILRGEREYISDNILKRLCSHATGLQSVNWNVCWAISVFSVDERKACQSNENWVYNIINQNFN